MQVHSDSEQAIRTQAYFHEKFGIPTDRIRIHPADIADPADKAAARRLYGDVILGIPASPFPEFIEAFVQEEVSRISSEWRLATSRLKDEPHHLWYLLRHILAYIQVHLPVSWHSS